MYLLTTPRFWVVTKENISPHPSFLSLCVMDSQVVVRAPRHVAFRSQPLGKVPGLFFTASIDAFVQTRPFPLHSALCSAPNAGKTRVLCLLRSRRLRSTWSDVNSDNRA